MCAQLKLEIDGREPEYFDAIGPLRKRFGGRNVVTHEGYGWLPWDNCLCPVNFEKTAAKLGFECVDTDDPFYVHWREATQ